MTDNQNNDAQVKDRLAASGISPADIALAHETSAGGGRDVLLDLLASYPLDDRLKKSVRDLFEEAGCRKHLICCARQDKKYAFLPVHF